MIQLIKKISLFGVVLAVSGVGVGVGQNLTHQLAEIQLVRADLKSEVTASKQEDRYEYLELFNRVLQFVRANYVDEVKTKTLVEGAIKGMLETLDPHSNF